LKKCILSFDYGESRIGVAIYEDGETKPLQTIQSSELWPTITELILDYKPDELVVGRPRNMNGDPTRQTDLAKAFADSLAQVTQLPVSLQDEALSSERALDRIGKKTTIKERKRIIDQIAAQIILEDYLS